MTRQARELAQELLTGIRGVLGNTLDGAYLYGSAVAGDFDPERSDLDLLVAVATDVDERQVGELRGMHDAFVAAHPEWDDRIDAAYLSTAALGSFLERESPIVVISPGEPLNAKRTSPGWAMNWHMVREHGVTLCGPPPASLIAETTFNDFLAAVHAHMAELPGRTEASGDPAFRAYAVVTACRALHACREHRQTSKRQAARWAADRLPEWADVIRWADAWRRPARHANPSDEDMLFRSAGFVRFAARELGVDTPRLSESDRNYGDVELKPSSIQGLGVFATRSFRAGERVRRVNLVREITREAPIREEDGERIEHCGYPDGKVILWGLPDRHVNHSCDPSAYEHYDGSAVYIVARRDIAAGEEITFDYIVNTSGGNTWPCTCGADRCRRGAVGDFFALPPAHQREYRPLLAEWFVRRHRGRIEALDAALASRPTRNA